MIPEIVISLPIKPIVQRTTRAGRPYLIGFHTQEYRAGKDELSSPIFCNRSDAWLGEGYYFWTEEEFAHYWGDDFKNQTGFYDIYRAEIDYESCINAVFDEEGYFYFRDSIEKVINHFRNNNLEITLQKVNRFLADNIWGKMGITGIIFDDIPHNSAKTDRIHSEIPHLYYKKRIQVVAFEVDIIHNFVLFKEEIAVSNA